VAGIDFQNEFVLDHRRKTLFLIVICVAAIISLRLFYLQVVRSGYYQKLAISNMIQRERIVAPRGIIRSSDGSKLVVNIPAYQINIVPGKIRGQENRLALACEWLGIGKERLFASLDEWKRKYPDGREMTVVQAAEKEQISVLIENSALFPFFRLVMKHRRYYPEGDLASHLLGYVGEATDEELRKREDLHPGALTGRTGIESQYEKYLRGEDGVRIVEVSAEGTRIGEFEGLVDDAQTGGFVESRPPVPGSDLYLTIDVVFQRAMEREFDWETGAVIAMNPYTGGILAAVSRPSYDPNIFMGGITSEEWDMLHRNAERPMFNRTVQAAYPPASTFKMIVGYAAMHFRAVSPNERLKACNGGYRFGNRYFKCWKPEGHGSMNLYEAIVNSCDVYFYQAGLRLEADQFAYAGRLFGFGRQTGIDLPSEAKGTIPDHSFMDRRFGKKKWTKGHLLNYSIGQGEMLATPVQLCQMAAMIANGGSRIRPHVVERIVAADGAVIFESDASYSDIPEIDEKIVAFLQKAMEGVVLSGTGRSSAVAGVSVAGKTGTAQNSGKDHALFVAFAPVRDPQIAIAIVMEGAGHGGAMAAPMAGRILKAWFNPVIETEADSLAVAAGGAAAWDGTAACAYIGPAGLDRAPAARYR
jgi:penicillin-binding protein 2